MIKESLRIFAVLLLFVFIIADDFPFYEKMKNPVLQLLFATIVIGLIFYDPTFGFLMGLVLMLIYYEIYKKIKQITVRKNQSYTETATEQIVQPEMLEYITDEHLRSAQNNIFDAKNYETEIVGLQHGFNNEELYGAQGLNKKRSNLIGFDETVRFSDF